MQRLSNTRWRLALWVVLALALVVMTMGTLYAAGEELERGAVLSGGSTHGSGNYIMRDVIGLTAAGAYISSSSGVGLCSGFGCESRSNFEPDDPDDPDPDPTPDPTPDPDEQIFMPQINGPIP
jgi:hypothetical protein